MKKGFTLIELLAVIVILAIIAAIAIPIVINIISDTKKSSQEQSVEMYIKAVELSIASNVLNSSNNKTSGKYDIIDNGKKIKKIVEEGKPEEEPIKVEYKGTGLTDGIIEIKNGKVTKLRGTKINGKYAAKVYDKIEFFDELPETTLTTGSTFNAKIKTLVSGEEASWGKDNESIKLIEFFSYGKLPKGYTKEELLKLDQVDVSDKQDKSILALYDGNGNVFIYSDKLIFFNSNSSYMFGYFNGIEKIKFGLVDTSEVTDMKNMFHNCISLTFLDVSNFDTSNVTDMSSMFHACKSLTSLNVSKFDTSNVTNMSAMFRECWGLSSIDISNFNTSNVTNMSSMFNSCSGLTKLDISNFNTSKVTSMFYMFHGCSSLTSLDLSNFNTSEVTNMTSMFHNCSSLTSLDLSNFDTSNVTEMTSMFHACKFLTSLNVSKFDTSNVTNMSAMFRECWGLSSIDISNFNTSNVTNMSSMFRNTSNLKLIEVSDKWIIGENTITTDMFNGCGTNTVTLKQS